MSEKNKIIKKITNIKQIINQIYKDKLFTNDFSKEIIEFLYEIDKYSKHFSLDIILKTNIHKTLKTLFQLSDFYLDIKIISYSILEHIFINIRNELFNYDEDIFHYFKYSKISIEFNKNNFIDELNELIKNRNYEKNYDNIRTDKNFLIKIKKQEIKMNNEYRRRERLKKIEYQKSFDLFLSNNNKNNYFSIFQERKRKKRKKNNINVNVINKKNHIYIIIKKSAISNIESFQYQFSNQKKNNFLNKKYQRNNKNKIKNKKNNKIIIEIPLNENIDLFFNH